MLTTEVKILLVDDHQMFRQGLSLLIKEQPNMTVVGEATNSQSALELMRTTSPDVVIMDIHLPGESGIGISRQILEEFPAVKIIALSGDGDLTVVHEALAAGIASYLTKENSREELVRAIRIVLDQRLYLSPGIASLVVTDYLKLLQETTPVAKPILTDRERQLLKLVAEGKRNKEIAADMNVTYKSVETYRLRLMKKLGCSSTADLTRYAIRQGIAAA